MNDDVLSIYDWFKRTMATAGRKVKDPQCDNIANTYGYRAVSAFVDKARGFGLDVNQMQALVKEIVKYSKERRLLYRGTAILNMADVFSICCDRLETSLEATDSLIEIIESSIHLVGQNQPLHIPEKIGGYTKLACLINSGKLPVELLALSRRCVTALRRLPADERTLFPSDVELLKTRIRLLMDKNSRSKLKAILKSDLLDSGVPV